MKKSFQSSRVEINELHVDGYGTTSDPKLSVFGALAGEELTVMPFSKRKKKIFAKTVEVHRASPHRVEPACPAAEYCGGCSLQHFESSEQIKFKHQFLLDSLGETKANHYFEPLTGPVENYRSKGRLGAKFVDKKNRVLVGFREKMKPYIADISDCTVLRDSVSSLIPALADFIAELSIARHVPQIEVAVGDSETALIFRHLEELSEADINLFKLFGKKNNIHVYLQPGDLNSTKKLYPEDGIELLTYALPEFELEYDFHPLDFTQVNLQINQKMVSRAIELLALEKSDIVFDGFCGIGNFSLALARICDKVIGVEGSENCVNRAQHNADKNGIKNCQFLMQDLFAESLVIPGLEEANKVLLDPPRSGAFEVCKKLASTKVERVVYVSCNPVTLARDAVLLTEAGFTLDGAGVIDMFPHTTHVESIACFVK
ncbi:MAG: 23S rRNA (uracil1939-C5)-methyltransferase [Candidatus Azotimanducaceae bacterium]